MESSKGATEYCITLVAQNNNKHKNYTLSKLIVKSTTISLIYLVLFSWQPSTSFKKIKEKVMRDCIEQFREKMFAFGITPPNKIIVDGQIHRFPTNSKINDTAGWLVLYPSYPSAGCFGDFREDIKVNWCSTRFEDMTSAERTRIKKQIEEIRHKHDIERKQRQLEAAAYAKRLLLRAKPAVSSHPYLIRKNVLPFGIYQHGNVLLIPMVNKDNQLVNLQRIYPDGTKRFLYGGRVEGCFSVIGALPISGRLYLGEGWATNATIHHQTGLPVVAAMNSGNLKPVALALREILTYEVEIVIAADNDRHLQNNPGLTKGQEVSELIGAALTWPRFPCDECRCSDFNDLMLCPRKEITL